MAIATRPPAGPIRPFHFPPFRRSRLGNGLSVLAVDLPGRRMATARLIVEAGALCDGPGLEGAALLTAQTLGSGTKQRDAHQLSEALDLLGATIHSGIEWDVLYSTLDVPRSRLEQAFELLAEVVLTPAFPEDEVTRLRDGRLNQIRQELAEPVSRGVRSLLENLYAPEFPLSRPIGGTLDSIASLNRDHLVNHHEAFATPASATLIVAGDLGGLDVDGLAGQLFGAWSSPEPERPDPAPALRDDRAGLTVVHRPGAVQSAILAAQHGAPYHIPDRVAFTMMNAILGSGGIVSRLNVKLREEKGYTYGAGWGADAGRRAGPMWGLATVGGDSTADAMTDMVQVIREMHDGGATAVELDRQVRHELGTWPVRYQTPNSMVGALTEMVVQRLPDDHLETYRDRVAAVTLPEVNEAARRHLRPDELTLVVVGDADKVAEPLRAAGLAPKRVVEDPAPG